MPTRFLNYGGIMTLVRMLLVDMQLGNAPDMNIVYKSGPERAESRNSESLE